MPEWSAVLTDLPNMFACGTRGKFLIKGAKDFRV